MAETGSLKSIVWFLTIAIVVTLAVYYIPSYTFLKSVIAAHTASILNGVGIRVDVSYLADRSFVGGVEIVRDCTGVQVFAVFLGLIAPLPNAPVRKKLVSLLVVSSLLYLANLFRVVLVYGLVYHGILPWALAHYPLSLILGVVGVFLFVGVTNRLMPEFGAYTNTLARTVRLRL
jgi:exosortase/archaeosortase family protein